MCQYPRRNAHVRLDHDRISYGSDADREWLQQLAERSQGSYYDATNPQNIERVFAAVFSNFVGSGG